uniref:EamA domain-containing protein n=1 Tax=Leptobrachium leishanense TaxID=445787 RepID=A0A8C5Q3G3_9ANUR
MLILVQHSNLTNYTVSLSIPIPLSVLCYPSWKSLGPHTLTPLLILKRIFPLCCLSLLTFYLYFMSLSKLSTTEVAALYSCSKAFCYLLSWTILREQFMGAKIVAVICCLAGVVTMSYTETLRGDAPMGRKLALSAAATAAVNEVLFRLVIGQLNFHDTVVFFGLNGVCNILLLWWVPLVRLQETLQGTDLMGAPVLEYLCGTVVLCFCECRFIFVYYDFILNVFIFSFHSCI